MKARGRGRAREPRRETRTCVTCCWNVRGPVRVGRTRKCSIAITVSSRARDTSGRLWRWAHALIQAVYYVLSTRKPFVDTAEPPRSPATLNRLIRHHTRRLRKLSCWLQNTTQIEPAKADSKTG